MGHIRSYYRTSLYPRQTNVAFDEAMYKEIRLFADKDNLSLAEGYQTIS